MKTKLTIILLFITFIARSQTLEHTFVKSVTMFQCSKGAMYYNLDIKGNKVTFYNPDYSVYKTISIPTPKEYSISTILCASDKMFNTDNLLEFLIVYHTPMINITTQMILYNENGTKLYDFGFNYFSAYFYTDGKKTKLFTMNANDTCRTYLLVGITTTAKSATISQNYAYPNPALSSITLPYSLEPGETSDLKIFNYSGQLIESKQIDSNFDRIILNVENYKKGIYFYSVKGVSNKFIVN